MTIQCVCQSCRHRWTVPLNQAVYGCPKCGGKRIVFEYAQVGSTADREGEPMLRTQKGEGEHS
jgi:DNA-directed RNA polymerase subunit M/transcription elongation factor TFIIS